MARQTVKLTDEEYRRSREIRAQEETAHRLLDVASRALERSMGLRQEWWDSVVSNHKINSRTTVAELEPRKPLLVLRPRTKNDPQIRITKLHYERNPPSTR